VGDLNTSLSSINRSSIQKTNKETSELFHILDQVGMVDIYRTFHSPTKQYTFFYTTHGTLSKIDHILGHKVSLNKFKKIKIAPCIISDHNGVKLDINNNTKKPRKYSNTWRLNNTLCKKQWVTEIIREEIKKILEFDEN
jgi:exonuclease III